MVHPKAAALGSWLSFIWQHPSNADARPAAIARAIGYQFKARVLRRPSVGHVGQRGRVVVNLHDNGASQSIYANPSDHAEMTVWRTLLGPGDLFLDIGANVGLYSLWAADCDAQVWAFEPNASCADAIEENFTISSMAVTVHRYALGAAEGTLSFTAGLGTNNHLVLASSQGHLDVPRDEVQVKTLDDVLDGRRARGAKIDVEGAERLVLEGARSTLQEHRIDALQLEWNHMSRLTLGEDRAPSAKLLASAGYLFARPVHGSLKLLTAAEVAHDGADLFALTPSLAQELGLTPGHVLP